MATNKKTPPPTTRKLPTQTLEAENAPSSKAVGASTQVQTARKHVVPASGQWAVKNSGASRASKLFDNRSDAISYGREMAKKERGELYIHGSDGMIRDHSSYSNDPIRTKKK